MLKQLKKLYKDPQIRMPFVITILVLVAAAAGFLIIFESRSNREYYLAVYENNQKLYTEQLAEQVELLMMEGKNDSEVILYLEENAEVSANSWSFICKDKEILFAKDQKTTANLRTAKKKDVFMGQMASQDLILTTSARVLNGNVYMIGTVTDRTYALELGNVPEHEIYLYMIYAAFIMAAVMAIIGIVAKLNYIEKNFLDTSRTLRRQNRKLEQAEVFADAVEKHMDVPARDGENLYDSELIRLFLQKSDDEGLRPLQIAFVDLIMENRYYSRQEMLDVLEGIKKFIGTTHVLGERKKGSLVILMYRTSRESAEDIVRQYQEYVKNQKSVPVRIRLVEVKEGQKAIDAYEKGWEEER